MTTPPRLSDVVATPVDLRAEVARLAASYGPHHVTLTLPTARPWSRRRENQVRLRNLLDRARDVLHRHASDDDVEALLRPGREAVRSTTFWRASTDGLALYLSPTTTVIHRLPFAPSVLSVVDRRFHVRPVWRHLVPDGRFYVLTLSAGGVQLFRASRYTMEAVELDDDVPTTLDAAMRYDEPVRSVRFHTKTPERGAGGRRPGIFYGHEDAGDRTYVKSQMERFFQAVDAGVQSVLRTEPTPPPLVLSGPSSLCGLYRSVSDYPALTDGTVNAMLPPPTGRTVDADAVHEAAWARVYDSFDRPRREAVERFHKAPAHQIAATASTVLLAATSGRVDTLFVDETTQMWGRLDTPLHSLRGADARTDVEQLTAATAQTLLHGGRVYVTDAEDVPGTGPVAALLRY